MTLRLLLVAVWLLAWPAGAAAQTLPVKLHTVPDAAEIYLEEKSGKQTLLGTSDRPLALDTARLLQDGYLKLVIKKQDYLDDVTLIQASSLPILQKGVWPPGVPLSLVRDDYVKVVFHTNPEGVPVYAVRSGEGNVGDYLGKSGEIVHLKKSAYWDTGINPPRVNPPEIVFNQQPRCPKCHATIDRPDLTQCPRCGSKLNKLAMPLPYYAESGPHEAIGVWENGRWPAENAFQLTPTRAWAPLYYAVANNKIIFSVAAVALVGMTVLGVRTERSRRLRERILKARNAFLEELQARAKIKEDTYIGSKIGNWRILEKLGAGGMAVVYKALNDETLDESMPVAVKLMSGELSDNDEFRKRFEREVEVCSKLNHPNIVRVQDFGNQDGALYLVMELVDGAPLRDYVQKGGLPLKEAIGYFLPILEGLHYAHKQGVVHRDLKPDNIMVLKSTGRIKIMDFGLARGTTVAKTQITQSGSVLGTPAYVSPEQITGGGMNKSSDQYSLGITFYELLAGKRPFQEEDSIALLFKHLSEAPTPLREWRPDVPEAVEKVILKMMEKDPADRYADLGECFEALQQAAEQSPEADAPSGPPLEPPRPRESYNTNVAS